MAERKKKTRAKPKGRRPSAARAHDAWAVTREIFEHFMDRLPAATFIKDAEGRTLYFNQFMRDVLGAQDSWIGKRSDELWPGPVGEHMCRDDAFTLEKGFTEREETVPTKDGTPRHYHTQKFTIPRRGEKPLLGGIALDISKRKAALRALETSEATLRAIFECAGEGIALVDPSTRRFVVANQRFAEMLGYTREEILRLRVEDVHPPDQMVAILDEFSAHVRGQRTESAELPAMRKDGTVFFVNITSTPVNLPDGRLQMGIFRDVTDRRRAAEALRESEERFRVVFENAPFGVAMVGADGRPALVNRAMTQMLGYSADQLRDLRFTDFTLAADARADEELFGQVMRGERETYRMEKRYIHADGSIVWGSLGVAAVKDRDGRVTHCIGVVEDITERKRMEAELKDIQAKMLQTQKLESLGVLAGGIAHDFNNLLMAIVGHAEVFLDEVPKDSRLLASAREIEIASRRGAELCRQMLAYAGRSKAAVEMTDINEIIVEMSRLLEASISKGAEVVYRLAKDLPAVRVDATQVRQILMNLVVNAAESLEHGAGTIVVSTGARQCDRDFLSATYVDDGLPEGEYVYLEVMDTGCGMDRATAVRVFDPFFTTKFTGRGLGLASVLGIVRGNGGAIRVQSEPQQGSTFTVLFPAMVTRAPADAPMPGPVPGWRGNGTVLVIDDEAGVRSVTARHLEKSGFEVLTADSGQSGLDLLAGHPDIGMVILDLAMPQMGGDECFAKIREMRPTLPVIMTSGYDESGVIQRMPNAAISGFLQKPFKRGELLAVVRRIMGDEFLSGE